MAIERECVNVGVGEWSECGSHWREGGREGEREGERDRMSLFPWDYIRLGLEHTR